MPALACAGWEGHALGWRGAGSSIPLPESQLITRTPHDIASFIVRVTDRIERPPIVIAHSMGALAAQIWAQSHSHRGLVLINPVVPSEVNARPIELPIDPHVAVRPMPFAVSREVFLQDVPEDLARADHSRLTPISPRIALEPTRWTVSVDPSAISGPITCPGRRARSHVPT